MLADWCPGLRECLSRVADPRDPRGMRRSLTSLLLAGVAAVLAGARSFTAIGEWIADAPPDVLACLRVRRDPLTRRFEPPDEPAIRRVLELVDADMLDMAVGSWLGASLRAAGQPQERPGHRRRALAVDGKALRGTRHASSDGQAIHLLAVCDQRAGTVLGQVDVDGKTKPSFLPGPRVLPADCVDISAGGKQGAEQRHLHLRRRPGVHRSRRRFEKPSLHRPRRRGLPAGQLQ